MKAVFLLLKNKYTAIVWTTIIFILCTLPSEHLLKENDKIAHLTVFSLFSFLWLFNTHKTYLIILLGVTYGIFIEFWQYSLPTSFNRSGDIWDAVADAIGVFIGWGIFITFKKIFPNS
jgi:VanZ family protein